MPRLSVKPHLLERTAELVAEHGPAALTFDALAEASGVSKGGLLYHFPTKHALVTDLLDDLLDRFEAAVEARAPDAPAPSWTRAYIDATFDEDASLPEVALALLQASNAVDEPLLSRCAQRFGGWHARLRADGLSEGLAAVVRYSCDGWWTYRAVAGPVTGTDADTLRTHLHALLDAEGTT